MHNQCISSEAMADFLEDRLAQPAHDQIEAHLAECERCLEEMLTIRQVMHQRATEMVPAVPHAVTQRALARVDRAQGGSVLDALMGWIRALSLECTRKLRGAGLFSSPALAPVRGSKVSLSDEVVLFTESFPGLDTEIEIEKINDRQANVKVTISRSSAKTLPVRITLLRSDREVTSYLADQAGVFFEAVPFGRYSLVYTHDGANIGQFDFSIKAPDGGGHHA